MSKKEESGTDFSSARFSAMADEDGSLRWKEPRVEKNTKAEERSSQRSSNQHRAGSQRGWSRACFLAFHVGKQRVRGW